MDALYCPSCWMVHPQRVAVLPAGQVLEHPPASHPPCPLLPLEVPETSNLDISVAIQPHTRRLAPQHQWCWRMDSSASGVMREARIHRWRCCDTQTSPWQRKRRGYVTTCSTVPTPAAKNAENVSKILKNELISHMETLSIIPMDYKKSGSLLGPVSVPTDCFFLAVYVAWRTMKHHHLVRLCGYFGSMFPTQGTQRWMSRER